MYYPKIMSMVKIEFRVLCADDGKAGETVRGLMSDFEITFAGKYDDFDHKGVKTFESVEEAEQLVHELKCKAGKDILSITLFIHRVSTYESKKEKSIISKIINYINGSANS